MNSVGKIEKIGKLIVIDGLDGSGKATQSQMLFEKLKQKNPKVLKISFPNYQDDSSILVKKYLAGEFGSSPEDVNSFAASSFYAIDRFISYKKYWKDSYLSGYTIICDRYVTSNLIHQMAKIEQKKWQEFINWIEDYEYNKLGLPRPDKVIYLDLDVDISQKLIDSRCNQNNLKKDIHEKDVDYLKRCQQSARYLSDLKKWNLVKCNDQNGKIHDKEFLSTKILSII